MIQISTVNYSECCNYSAKTLHSDSFEMLFISSFQSKRMFVEVMFIATPKLYA